MTSEPQSGQPGQPGHESLPDAFATTHWTRVVAARGDSPAAKAALSELCDAYYQPVIAFLRGSGRPEDDARELAHEFFSRLLERRGLDGADPHRGRFRSYLLGALRHFLQNVREREGRQKRGSGQEHVSLSGGTDTSPGIEVADPTAGSSDRAFDRQWALTVLERAITRVEQELAAAGRERDFETLKPWLTGDCAHYTQAEAARRLEMSEGAVKVAVHRLRKRFRQAVKTEVAATLHNTLDLQDELNHLVTTLAPLLR